MDITQMSLEELKALAYDQIVILESAQNNLRQINAEIEKRKDNPIVAPAVETVEVPNTEPVPEVEAEKVE